jgi:hypothetical protein
MSQDYDEYLPIDPRVQKGTRDFADEMIVMLLEAQHHSMIKEMGKLYNGSSWINERNRKHTIYISVQAVRLSLSP